MKHRNPFSTSSQWLAVLAGALSFHSCPTWADTILTFDQRPDGQGHNAQIIPTFGDNAVASSPGVLVDGSGTPDIDLTFGGAGGAGRWEFYTDSVWSAAQMDAGTIDKSFDITFTPKEASGVALKSFNLHPYYTTGTTYDYNWTVTDLDGNVLKEGQSRAISDGSKTPVDISYSGALGQSLVLRLLRSAGAEDPANEGRGDSIAIDDLRFGQLPEIPPLPVGVITYPTTANAASPEVSFAGLIADGQKKVVPSTIQLRLDGTLVNPTVTAAAGKYDVKYTDAAKFHASGSSHVFEMVYKDDAVPAASYTNSVAFNVVDYRTISLPQPFAFENFDSVDEGTLPAGWTAASFTPGTDPEFNLQDLNSASYESWNTVDRARFLTSMLSYTEHTPTTDYRRVLENPPFSIVNGLVIKELGEARMLFNTSGYRSGGSQYSEVFSPDFDCAGKTGVALAFHSLWEQNQDSIAAVEYSIDSGASWLPIAYFIDSRDILPGGEEPMDANLTLTTARTDTAKFNDPNTGEARGNAYADYVKAPLESIVAEQIQGRADDNPTSSKRVEVFALPQADNQSKVRLRFAHAGTDSWYWGIDNVGLYSLSAAPKLTIVRSGSGATVTWTGEGTLERSSSITGPWAAVPAGEIVNKSHAINTIDPSSAQFYRLR